MMALPDLAFRFKRLLLGRQRVRRTRLYGVGIGKSGTNSISKMFSKNVRAVHEPQAVALIDKYLDWRNGRVNDREMTEWVRARDREMALEVDSSWLNVLILEMLVREFPDARFVLTIRDCYSWLNSNFNHSLRAGNVDPRWKQLREFRFRHENFVHAPEEQVLKKNGLLPLDAYFSRWAAHNEMALAKISGERLFVVRTDEIRLRAHDIADFASLPRTTIRLEHAHAFQNPIRREIIHEIDRGFLEQKADQHCRPLMARFFPEIKSLDDAKL
jgi:Sulfotransferase domain